MNKILNTLRKIIGKQLLGALVSQLFTVKNIVWVVNKILKAAKKFTDGTVNELDDMVVRRIKKALTVIQKG